MTRSAADRWRQELLGWTIPDRIRRQAPEPPWGFPPALFAVEHARPALTGSLHRLALEALGDGGTLLDVGCGGGAASIPVAAAVRELIGVDNLPAMLEAFSQAALAAGVPHRSIQGVWPAVAAQVPTVDVVVCRNVVYNVADVIPFVRALTQHARRRVIVELTETHPSVSLAPLWRRFWDLPRPDGPTADLFDAVLRQAGIDPSTQREIRPSVKAQIDPKEHVAFVRRRLCLDASHDAEIASALEADAHVDETAVVVMAWRP